MMFHKSTPPSLSADEQLRRYRPLADSTFVRTLADEIRTSTCEDLRRRPRGRRVLTVRPVLATCLTAALFCPLAASGELSRAASGLEHTVSSFAKAIDVTKRSGPAHALQPSATLDQYRRPPGCKTKAKSKYDAQIAAARRADEARIATARRRRDAALRRCTTASCRLAAKHRHEREVADATQTLHLQLSKAQKAYLRLLRRCKS
jgi:hypothetical protein